MPRMAGSFLQSRSFRRLCAVSAVAAGWLVAPLGVGEVLAAPDVQALVEKADRRFSKGGWERAAELYAKADRKAGGRSVEALVGLTRARLKLGDYAEVITVARRWQEVAAEPRSRAAARLFEAEGHYWQGMTARWKGIERSDAGLRAAADRGALPGRPALLAAVRVLRESLPALESGGSRAPALLLLADTLVELDDLPGAEQALADYAAAGGSDPYAENLRCWIDQLDTASTMTASTPGIEPPEKIYTPYPGYTAEARLARIEGSMRLRMAITGQGDVRCLRVIRGLPYGMVRATTAKVLGWRFIPALRDGQPVPVFHDLTVNFTLKQ